jgi:hypothetical protein
MTIQNSTSIAEEFDEIESKRASLALSEAKGWLWMGPLLATIFLVISSMQAFWALHDLSGMGSDGSTFSAVIVGLIAVGLIAGSNVMSIKMGTQGVLGKIVGAPILAGLIGFSLVTSAMHLAGEVIGGHQSSVRSSPEYKLAQTEYKRAATNLAAVERSAALADEAGDIASAGHIRRTQLPRAEQRIVDARGALMQVTKSGQAGVDAIVLTEMATLIGLDPGEFAVAFSLGAVLLMELLRIWLTVESAMLIRKAVKAEKRSPKPQAAHAPELRAVA